MALTKAAILSTGDELTTGRTVDTNAGFIAERLEVNAEDLYAEALQAMERHLLTRVLRHTAGNQVQAAKILGITRGSLRTKIRALGISIERSVGSDDQMD